MENSDSLPIISKYFLPTKYRIYGYILSILGLASFSAFFLFSVKPKFLELPVFAISSSFFEKKTFAFMKNNMSEEIVGLLLLFGIYFLALTKEKIEKPEYDGLRINSFILAIWINLFFNIFGFLFFFGFSYLWIAFFNIYSIPILYFCILRIKIFRNN